MPSPAPSLPPPPPPPPPEYGFAAHWKYKEKLDSEDEWLDKETQYKRWLTNYKLALHDKKVRPSGSPPTDSSLKSLGVAYLDGKQPEDQGKVDPFLRHDRFKLQQPAQRPVRILLQTQDMVEAQECPQGTTAEQLAQRLAVASLPGYAMTVNGRIPAHPGAVELQSGDLVQVVPLEQALSRSPPEQRRELLQQALASEPVAVAAAPASSASAAWASAVLGGSPVLGLAMVGRHADLLSLRPAAQEQAVA